MPAAARPAPVMIAVSQSQTHSMAFLALSNGELSRFSVSALRDELLLLPLPLPVPPESPCSPALELASEPEPRTSPSRRLVGRPSDPSCGCPPVPQVDLSEVPSLSSFLIASAANFSNSSARPLGSLRLTGSFEANAYGFVVAAVRGISNGARATDRSIA